MFIFSAIFFLLAIMFGLAFANTEDNREKPGRYYRFVKRSFQICFLIAIIFAGIGIFIQEQA